MEVLGPGNSFRPTPVQYECRRIMERQFALSSYQIVIVSLLNSAKRDHLLSGKDKATDLGR